MELHQYGYSEDSPIKLIEPVFFPDQITNDKYLKLDMLREQIGQIKKNELVVIDASKLAAVLENSSDWVRFLANLQFSLDGLPDIIVHHFELERYVDIVNILKVFNNLNDEKIGYWKQDRRTLFFIPVTDKGSRFWFNHLLCSNAYSECLKINQDIDLYHLNLHRVMEEEADGIAETISPFTSLLFSKSKKLLNFELLIDNGAGLTLFEETTRSMLYIDINTPINEN